MVQALRKWFNDNFTTTQYDLFLKELHSKHPGTIDFRVAETPIFVDKVFTGKMLSACEKIVDVIMQPNFKALTKNAIPEDIKVPNETSFSQFIAFDFGICENDKGDLEPQLIEMQGFPTLFCYQVWHDEITSRIFNIPDNYTAYLNGFNKDSYLNLIRDIILKDCQPEEVILLEILPHQQKTRIDFYCTADYLNIPIVCLSELILEGNQLFYINNTGKKIAIKRIYNRIIFDDLQQQSAEMQEKGKILSENLDVEWVPHPNWFYRISKYTLPFIQHPYIPLTTFLDEIKELPEDLENYVLKPLFSFAGQGVVIDVSKNDISAITDPQNWILQR